MPFKSKAQQRFMFATMPEEARRWAKETPNIKDLPEKEHPQVNPKHHKLEKASADGMFFQKAAQPRGGHFFRDLPGRGDATFQKHANGDEGYGGGNVTPEDADTPMGDTPDAGSDAGGGMYGTGKGAPKNAKEKSKLAALLDKAGPGKTRSAVKVASASPSDWEEDMIGLPTGFHRPTHDQPEALDEGGERFHSTLAKPPETGSTAPSVRHGVREGGSLSMPATAGHQMGKHAAPRFLGTSFAKHALDDSDYEAAKSYAKDRYDEAKGSLMSAGRDLGGTLDKGIRTITKSPVGTAVAGLVAAKLIGHGARGIGRGAARVFGHRPVPKPGLIGQAAGGLRRLVTGK